jgi:DNA recombination protein RmuC
MPRHRKRRFLPEQAGHAIQWRYFRPVAILRRMITAVLVGIAILVILQVGLLLLFWHSRLQISLLDRSIERTDRTLREEMGRNREENAKGSKSIADTLAARLLETSTLQQDQLEKFSNAMNTLTAANEQRMEKVRETVELRLGALQADNAAKLETIRLTVDEKLNATLQQRLGESFKLVSDRLELVHRGLGEMQSLANGVGDLKKVLTNIKTRGNWGEVQLGNLLEQLLTPDQYAMNVQVNPATAERVEFAVKLPGRNDHGKCVWLPIDAKFPQEDYQRLIEAAEQGNIEEVSRCSAALTDCVCTEAKKIREKYIVPPHTTDFAILFLPTEGLFSEVLRRPGLCDGLLRDYRVILSGPTTLAATLSSLQMGFRTLAIEKRSSEVWQVLGAVRTEFSKFGEALDKVQKKLQEASNAVEGATTRSRVLQRTLKGVESAPQDSPLKLHEEEMMPFGLIEPSADSNLPA